MTDPEINIAIALECGWEQKSGLLPGTTGKITLWLPPGHDGRILESPPFPGIVPPDYVNDLNLMHEAEKYLNAIKPAHYSAFVSELQDVRDEDSYEDYLDKRAVFGLLTATARQRAEAFLKTVGKWKQ